VGARGTHGVFAPSSPLKTWLESIYKPKAEGVSPNYPAYSTALGILGLKAAFEKAKIAKLQSVGANKGVKEEMEKAYQLGPGEEEIIAAFTGLTFDSPSGKMTMGLGKGHQAVSGTAYGTTKLVNGQVTVTNIKQYPAQRVQPPEGVQSPDWIKSGMKPAK
jgi:branched-chain amino acid transport system substrate-binding protein